MRSIRKYFIISLLVVMAGVLWSCTTDEDNSGFEPKTPDLTLDSAMESVNVGKNGDEFTVNLKSNLPWRAKSLADWIVMGKDSGLGDGDFTFSVVRNRTINSREADIVVWITEDYQKTLRVIQAPSEAGDLIINYYVKTTGVDANDGLSWEKPTTLAKAIDAMVNGDIIHIAAGTYSPSITITGGDQTKVGDKTFEIHSNVTIIGGYPATATSGAVADPKANPTILSGTMSDGKAYHVVAITAPIMSGKKVSISGVTITNGEAAESGTGDVPLNGARLYRFYGGGLIVGASVAELTDCKIIKNKSGYHAGGVFVMSGSNVLFERCEISENTTLANGTNGAGLFNEASTVTLNHSIVNANSCSGVGAGIYAFHTSQPTYTYVYNSLVTNNDNDPNGASQTRRGGGFYARENSVTVLVNSTISGNRGGKGAGVSLYGANGKSSKMDIVSCTFSGNNALTEGTGGGGIEISTNTTLNISNTIVSGNTNGEVVGKYTSFNYGVIGSAVYGADGSTVAGANFDASTMLAPLADNGGLTKTMKLIGDNNPATTNGMSHTDLIALGLGYTPTIGSNIMSVDQTGASRSGKTVMGACIK